MVLHVCSISLMSLFSISVQFFANFMASVRCSCLMLGQKLTMSKLTKHLFFMLSILLNHSSTSYEFFHWVKPDFLLISLTIFSSITLLSSPSWFFPGFNVLHSVSNGNFGLWSFMVINASDFVYFGIFLFFIFLSNMIISESEFIVYIKLVLLIL